MPSEPAHVSIDVADVERIAALGWRGLEEARFGGWLLRAAGGFTGRSNSALVLGAPPKTEAWLPDLLHWYADRGLPPMVQIPLPGGEAIDAVLDAAGWRTHDLVRFLTGDLEEIRTSTTQASTPAGLAVRLDAEPDDAWLAAYHYRGARLPGHAREVLLRAEEDIELSFASLRAPAEGGAAAAVLAVARGAVARGWLGVTAVTVSEEHRRRGHGTRLMAELVGWAAERGARAIYLQVAAENAAALRLYSRLGFHHHHDYRYRIGPLPNGD
ncbi:MAG: GNAT family N-acetyltransferase [Actinomycetota bacterium]|nr:GNAT family N-acetyltransferase [Actinomycetota bacterium]